MKNEKMRAGKRADQRNGSSMKMALILLQDLIFKMCALKKTVLLLISVHPYMGINSKRHKQIGGVSLITP